MKRVLSVALLAIACGCAHVDVQTETQPGASPAAFATYAQAPPPATAPDTPRYDAAVGERLQEEIASQLDAKGYRRVDAADAELRVGFEISGRPGTKLVNAGDPDVDYYEERAYVAGTLRIQIFDARSEALLWQGVGEADLFTSGALINANVEDAALNAARAILAKLPASGTKP